MVNPIDVLMWIGLSILALVFGSMLMIMVIIVVKEMIEQRKKNRR